MAGGAHGRRSQGGADGGGYGGGGAGGLLCWFPIYPLASLGCCAQLSFARTRHSLKLAAVLPARRGAVTLYVCNHHDTFVTTVESLGCKASIRQLLPRRS